MSDKTNQPNQFDAVLGGETPPPIIGAVLGGIEGVKNRFKSSDAKERASALIDALKHQEEGFKIVLSALKDPSDKVQLFASRLLRDKYGEQGKRILLKHNPQQYFTMLEDWKFDDFYPNLGITPAICTAYNVNLYCEELMASGVSHVVEEFNLDALQTFLNNPQVTEVEALACWMPDEGWIQIFEKECNTLTNMLCEASDKLKNLKALFIGDRRNHEYKKSRILLNDITPILESFQNLEVLKLHVNPFGKLFSKKLNHQSLKTFILETADNSPSTIAQVCSLELPSLEYIQLWGGKCSYCPKHFEVLFSGALVPNLSYLSLPSFRNTDEMVRALVKAPIMQNLAVLDISMGILTDKGAEALLNCPSVNQLHTLNIAKNCISPHMVQQLSELDCRLIAHSQDIFSESSNGYRSAFESDSRYWALYE